MPRRGAGGPQATEGGWAPPRRRGLVLLGLGLGLLLLLLLLLLLYLPFANRSAGARTPPVDLPLREAEAEIADLREAEAEIADLRAALATCAMARAAPPGQTACEGACQPGLTAGRVALDPNASGGPPGTYPQVGYLVPAEEGEAGAGRHTAEDARQPPLLLPLYGRPSLARRYRWYYYTIPGGAGGGLKIPVRAAGRDCMAEVGCDELLDGDRVEVPDLPGTSGGGAKWKARIYQTAVARV